MDAVKSNQNTLEDLREKMVKLSDNAKIMQATADAEKRDLSVQEQAEVDGIFAAFEATEQEIARREKILANEAKLAAPQARITKPVEPRQTARVELVEAKGAWGWRSMGEFSAAVRFAGRGKVDPRLIVATGPTSWGNESTPADGGYAVPPDFRQDIIKHVMGEDALLSRTDQQTTSSNAITFPIDATTPWQSSGGILATWENEGGQKDQSKPTLGQLTVRANKLTALVPVTDELLEDVGAMANYLRVKTPEKMNFAINDAIINGSGVGRPLGILNSPALVTVDEDDSQDADTVTFGNVVRMWGRLYAPYRRNACWLINQDVEAQLQAMAFPGTGTAVPVYIPPGGLSGAPYATLFGRPIIVTEACPELGTTGDIILADLSQYLTVVKAGGIRSDISMHLWFDYDITAFRYVIRIGGQPWLSAPIDRKNGSNTLSSIVVIEDREGQT
jgi:HK97 family phage major capsid protein